MNVIPPALHVKCWFRMVEFRCWIWHIIYQSVFSQRRLLLARNHPQHLDLADYSIFILQNGYNRLVNLHVPVFGDYLLLKKKKPWWVTHVQTALDQAVIYAKQTVVYTDLSAQATLWVWNAAVLQLNYNL